MGKTRRSKKISRRNQKLYKMKGCSKKYLGGNKISVDLAYPSNNVYSVSNPYLAYTGTGGSSCSSNTQSANLAYPQNTNGSNPAYPSTGPPSTGYDFLNPQGSQQGGAQMGGNCGCGIPQMGGMSHRRHRRACKCSSCKTNKRGGSGNNGIPYPNGLVGKPWTPAIGGWPGVTDVAGDSNHLAQNTYDTDVQRAIISTGSSNPYTIGGKKTRRRRKQRGGTFTNFLTQDLINLGRQFQFGLGSAYNGIAGYSAPTNPLPWKGQFSSEPNLTAIKANLV